MIHWSDLTPEEQADYGNGCGAYANFLNVPDFIFTASCRQHDFYYSIGCGANYWYENIWKFPYYKVRADLHFGYWMLRDSYLWWHYIVAVVYTMGVLVAPLAWWLFDGGPWKTIDQVLQNDRDEKRRLVMQTHQSTFRRQCCKRLRRLFGLKNNQD